MYTVEQRTFENALYIGGPLEYLETAYGEKPVPGSLWIWSRFCCRVHMRKYFERKNGEAVHLILKCDNPFTLYCNDSVVAENVTRFEGDITAFALVGQNRLNLLAKQSDSTDYFTAALSGMLTVGERKLPTDASWQCYRTATFWENDEPDDWRTLEPGHDTLLTCPIHPRAIKHSLYLRKTFDLPGEVREAFLFLSCRGEGEAYLNGNRTDDEVLSQGVMDAYREYRRLDVTSLLHRGKNVLGVLTGNGWLNSCSHSEIFMFPNLVLAQLEVTLKDGRTVTVVSDESWRCALSPFDENDVQYGERYDARKEIPDWCKESFDDSLWCPVAAQKPDTERFTLRTYQPVRIMRRIEALSVSPDLLVDFGENCAGRYELRLKNTRPGQKVCVRMCEALRDDGSMEIGPYVAVYFDRDSAPGGGASGAVRNIDQYICAGAAEEVYTPRFTFTGFRYAKIEGIDKDQFAGMTMLVMHNDLPITGWVHSSDKAIEAITEATRRTWHANCFNGPMDCPTREKNYWTGDTQWFASTACYLEDTSALLARWTEGGRKMCPDPYGWGDEIYELPWTLYRFYGDVDLLKTILPRLLAFVKQRRQSEKDGLPEQFLSPFNDHVPPRDHNQGPTVPPDFYAAAYYCRMLNRTAQICDAVGAYETASEYVRAFEASRDAFFKKYYLPDENDLTPRSQTALVMALAFDLLPPTRRKLAAATLAEKVRRAGALDTGYTGTRYLMGVLCTYGYEDLASLLLHKTDYPSWQHMIAANGTITETWDGSGAHSHYSESRNHFGLGTVTGWFFEYLAGIRFELSEPGFTHLVLQPVFLPDVAHFDVNFHTVSGRIAVRWERCDGKVCLHLEAAMPTTLILPGKAGKEIPAGTFDFTV